MKNLPLPGFARQINPRKAVVLIGLALLVFCWINPPWIEIDGKSRAYVAPHPSKSIFNPPRSGYYSPYKIDFARLSLMSLVIAAVTGGVVYAIPNRVRA